MTYINGVRGVVSTNNKFPTNAAPETTTLAANASYTGTGEDVSAYAEIVVFAYSTLDSAGSGLSLEFSTNNVDWDKTVKYTTQAELSRTLSTPVFAKYFRIIYTNGSVGTATVRLQVIYHTTKSITPLNEVGDTVVNVSNISSSFGELHAVQLQPLVELDFIYGVNSNQINTISRSTGSQVIASTTNRSHLEITAGASDNSLAQLSSIDTANYRPGQGIDIRFTSVFDTPVSDTTQLVGVGSEDDGYFFGYNIDKQFGVLRRFGGKRRIEKLNLSGQATSTTDVNITLDSVEVTVGITASKELADSAYEISNGGTGSIDFADIGEGWETKANGNDVYFIALTSGVRDGVYTYDVNGSGLTGTLTTDLGGNTTSDYWFPSSEWNVDKADGTSILPTIDYTMGNVYRITYQWLGYGMINYFIENPVNGMFQPVHKIRFANTGTNTSIANPKQPLFIQSKKYTNAPTDIVKIKVPSMCALLAGNFPKNYPIRNSRTRFISSFNLNSNIENSVISFRNKLVFNNIQSTAKIILESISIANIASKPLLIKLYKNLIVDGSITWTEHDTVNNESLIQYNESQTTLVSNTGVQLYAITIYNTSALNDDLLKYNISIYPGETLIMSVMNLGSGNISNSEFAGTLNWIEDI